MIGKKEMFTILDNNVKSEFTLGNDNKVIVIGKGRINILSKQGEKKHILDVYFVEGLRHNLMSIGQLFEKGYIIYFKNMKCIILERYPSNHLITKVQTIKIQCFLYA